MRPMPPLPGVPDTAPDTITTPSVTLDEKREIRGKLESKGENTKQNLSSPPSTKKTPEPKKDEKEKNQSGSEELFAKQPKPIVFEIPEFFFRIFLEHYSLIFSSTPLSKKVDESRLNKEIDYRIISHNFNNLKYCITSNKGKPLYFSNGNAVYFYPDKKSDIVFASIVFEKWEKHLNLSALLKNDPRILDDLQWPEKTKIPSSWQFYWTEFSPTVGLKKFITSNCDQKNHLEIEIKEKYKFHNRERKEYSLQASIKENPFKRIFIILKRNKGLREDYDNIMQLFMSKMVRRLMIFMSIQFAKAKTTTINTKLRELSEKYEGKRDEEINKMTDLPDDMLAGSLGLGIPGATNAKLDVGKLIQYITTTSVGITRLQRYVEQEKEGSEELFGVFVAAQIKQAFYNTLLDLSQKKEIYNKKKLEQDLFKKNKAHSDKLASSLKQKLTLLLDNKGVGNTSDISTTSTSLASMTSVSSASTSTSSASTTSASSASTPDLLAIQNGKSVEEKNNPIGTPAPLAPKKNYLATQKEKYKNCITKVKTDLVSMEKGLSEKYNTMSTNETLKNFWDDIAKSLVNPNLLLENEIKYLKKEIERFEQFAKDVREKDKPSKEGMNASTTALELKSLLNKLTVMFTLLQEIKEKIDTATKHMKSLQVSFRERFENLLADMTGKKDEKSSKVDSLKFQGKDKIHIENGFRFIAEKAAMELLYRHLPTILTTASKAGVQASLDTGASFMGGMSIDPEKADFRRIGDYISTFSAQLEHAYTYAAYKKSKHRSIIHLLRGNITEALVIGALYTKGNLPESKTMKTEFGVGWFLHNYNLRESIGPHAPQLHLAAYGRQMQATYQISRHRRIDAAWYSRARIYPPQIILPDSNKNGLLFPYTEFFTPYLKKISYTDPCSMSYGLGIKTVRSDIHIAHIHIAPRAFATVYALLTIYYQQSKKKTGNVKAFEDFINQYFIHEYGLLEKEIFDSSGKDYNQSIFDSCNKYDMEKIKSFKFKISKEEKKQITIELLKDSETSSRDNGIKILKEKLFHTLKENLARDRTDLNHEYNISLGGYSYHKMSNEEAPVFKDTKDHKGHIYLYRKSNKVFALLVHKSEPPETLNLTKITSDEKGEPGPIIKNLEWPAEKTENTPIDFKPDKKLKQLITLNHKNFKEFTIHSKDQVVMKQIVTALFSDRSNIELKKGGNILTSTNVTSLFFPDSSSKVGDKSKVDDEKEELAVTCRIQ